MTSNSRWRGAPGEVQTSGPRFTARSLLLDKIFRRAKPARALDIGCGRGAITRVLARRSRSVLATEVTGAGVDAATTALRDCPQVPSPFGESLRRRVTRLVRRRGSFRSHSGQRSVGAHHRRLERSPNDLGFAERRWTLGCDSSPRPRLLECRGRDVGSQTTVYPFATPLQVPRCKLPENPPLDVGFPSYKADCPIPDQPPRASIRSRPRHNADDDATARSSTPCRTPDVHRDRTNGAGLQELRPWTRPHRSSKERRHEDRLRACLPTPSSSGDSLRASQKDDIRDHSD